MLYKLRGLSCIVFGFVGVTFWIAGCGGGAKYTPKESSAVKDDRAISLVQKMRTEAVSSRVGRWAVVIGISDYKYDTRKDPAKGIPDLRFADEDARAFARFLTSPAGGAFRPDHVLLLTDRKATIKKVRKGIGDFLARSLEDDLVIIFYAGHGIPDPKSPENLYLAAYDTEPGNYYGTALPMWEIDVALNRTIRSKRVFVFADACHSAGVGGSRGKSASKEFNEYMQRLAGSKEGVTKITASRADELSQERENLGGGHGVFTYYLLQALSGKADENRDGFVTMTEAYDFLYDRVRSDTRHSQNPWASSYVSSDIPLGIVDAQVLAAVKSRAEGQSQRPVVPKKTYYAPAPAEADLPKDSIVAVKLARAKLAKDEAGVASEMVEAVIRRNDKAKPDALLLKMEILLKDEDLKEAEDVEDRLVIPYPKHPAAQKGARLVYEHYLKEMKGTTPGEEIRSLEAYLSRHREGLLEKEARDKVKGIRAGVRAGYEKGFNESLIMAKGYIDRRHFDRARAELDRARDMAKEALSGFGVALDRDRVAQLRTLAVTEEEKHQYKKAFDDAKSKAARQPLEGKVNVWREFVGENPVSPHLREAEQTLSALERDLRAYRDRKFQEYFSRAEPRLRAGDYTNGYQALKSAKEYATRAQTERVDALARQYNAPPEVRIEVAKSRVEWDTPLKFSYSSSDREGDRVRVVSWDFGDGKSVSGESPRHTYAKWGGTEKQRSYVVRLKATDGHSTVEAKKEIIVKRQDCVARDDQYCKYGNGVVRDTKTGLEWKAGPNRDTGWNEARSWVQSLNLDGGGWRMPSMDELEGLYRKGMGSHNLTSLLLNTNYKYLYVWSGETKGSSNARAFLFYPGGRRWSRRYDASNGRAFAVRSRSDG